jgi:IS30 family transposase
MASQLTIQERDRIAELRCQGALQCEIATSLGRARSTISRELRRNRTGPAYYAGQAQQQSRQRRRERPLVRKLDDPHINHLVRSGLAQQWSPEQITGRMKQQAPGDRTRCVSAPIIYQWIKRSADRPHWEACLRRRGKRPCRRKNTATTGDAARIAQRPDVIEQRGRLGDFEGDTVLGPAGTGGVATLVDRQSRYALIVKVHTKQADHVHHKIKQRLQAVDAACRHSITFDNGTEFARCHRLEGHMGITLYFADPGCPYQRGTNENTNGLLRQYFPKGTDFRDITHAEVRRAETLLNNRPRACLGFRTPSEVFFEKTPPAGCD